ncbi:hypothetical protein DKG34_20910 [Streptomyces sp. NWU49]|uniref:Uncharacterized protein n=2 Tax=Streptomyces TaxID=1883 RepID=A0ABX6AJQ9_STRVD|nr:hypothetical protein DKG34_20910 [Streptomyces sp. NWU49]QEU87287.1 hypothetical protein CP969_23365 [Streptomyces viridosporus T7A]
MYLTTPAPDPQEAPMSADRSTRRPAGQEQPQSLSGVPVRDLLAACAAAAAISTPPRAPEPRYAEPAEGRDHHDHREAA